MSMKPPNLNQVRAAAVIIRRYLKGPAMKKSRMAAVSPRLVLRGDTAAELMTPNPVSLAAAASVKEAAAFLTDHHFSAAPVIDNAGRPIGVLSRSDIVIHDREKAEFVPPAPEYYQRS